MNKRVTDLIEAARQLTPEEQEELLARLHRELLPEGGGEEGSEEEIEAAWVEEVERRIADAGRGNNNLLELDQVIERARARLRTK